MHSSTLPDSTLTGGRTSNIAIKQKRRDMIRIKLTQAKRGKSSPEDCLRVLLNEDETQNDIEWILRYSCSSSKTDIVSASVHILKEKIESILKLEEALLEAKISIPLRLALE